MRKRQLQKLGIGIVLFFFADYIGSYFLLTGLNKNYGLDREAKIFVVGHSHMMMGIDKQKMEELLHCDIAKYTRSGVTIDQRKLMTEQYLYSDKSSKLKIALVGVDCFTLSEGGISANSHTLFYPFMDEGRIGDYVRKESTFLEYWQHKILRLTRYGDDLINASMRGWKDDDANYKNGQINLDEYRLQRAKWKSNIELRSDLKIVLEQLIDELVAKNIKVYLVNTPTLGDNNHIEEEQYDKVISYYHSLAENNDMVTFIDFNPKYEYEYSLFFDPLHLNVSGQQVVTDALIQIIKEDTYFRR